MFRTYLPLLFIFLFDILQFIRLLKMKSHFWIFVVWLASWETVFWHSLMLFFFPFKEHLLDLVLEKRKCQIKKWEGE